MLFISPTVFNIVGDFSCMLGMSILSFAVKVLSYEAVSKVTDTVSFCIIRNKAPTFPSQSFVMSKIFCIFAYSFINYGKVTI